MFLPPADQPACISICKLKKEIRMLRDQGDCARGLPDGKVLLLAGTQFRSTWSGAPAAAPDHPEGTALRHGGLVIDRGAEKAWVA